MMAEGPAAKRPPHIWLEPELPLMSARPPCLKLILGALALPLLVPALAACDRQASPSTQPSSAPETPAATPATGPNAATGTIDTSHKGSAMPRSPSQGQNPGLMARRFQTKASRANPS
jgi:hypothetical protein